MQPTIPAATNIQCENEAGTQFSAEINGRRWSGIREGSTDWKSVEKAIAEGAVVKPFVPATIQNPALKELADLDAIMPRYIEDLLDVMPSDQRDAYLAKGTKVSGVTKGDIKAQKESLRAKM